MTQKQAGLRLPDDLLNEVDAYAASVRLNRSSVVRLALQEYLAARKDSQSSPSPCGRAENGLADRLSRVEAAIKELQQRTTPSPWL